MGKKVIFCIFVILFILFISIFSNFISAAVSLGNKSYNLEKNYAPGKALSGWINISIENEPASASFSNNINSKSMALIDFLGANSLEEGMGFRCFPIGCEKKYLLTNPENNKAFSLNYNQEKTISIKITGTIYNIGSLTFDISVSNEKSCLNPLEIDLLDDGTIDWKAKDYSGDYSCTFEEGTGCFNAGEKLSEVQIGTTRFCEKIKLTKGDSFMLGAWVKKGTSKPGSLTMELYSIGGDPISSCNLPEPSLQGGEIGCTIDYENPGVLDYNVCIKANQSTDYNISMENVNPCGFHPPNDNVAVTNQTIFHDYFIFARGEKFGNIGSFTLNPGEYASQQNPENPDMLVDYISQYILKNYGNNCTSGCSIPIKFKAYQSMDVTLSNLNLEYTTDENNAQTENKFYNTATESGMIDSDFLKLEISVLNISVPQGFGNKTFNLYLGNSTILSQKINIIKMPEITKLSPTLISAAIPVKFTAETSSPENKSILKYNWNFGDGSSEEETTINSVTHTYSVTGAYSMELRITDDSGLENSRTFMIIAGNPKTLVNSTLKEYRKRVNGIREEINKYPKWYKSALEKSTGIDDLDSSVKTLEKKFEVASLEDEYINLMNELVSLDVPVKLEKSSEGKIPVVVDKENINLDALDRLGAGSYEQESEDSIKDAIVKWASDTDLEADFFTLSLYGEESITPILSYFKLKITPSGEKDIENYFVINQNAIINSQDVKEMGNDSKITGVRFDSLSEREIEFVIFGDVDITALPVYISPEFSKLEISTEPGQCNNNGKCEEGETWKNCRNDCKPTGRTILYIFILIFLAFVSYIILQEWYKRRYESYLFKNRNDLFNLVNFINNARMKGLDKKEIEKSLKQYGWSLEQVAYAFKKFSGKKTGMPFEIGFKFPEKK